MGSTLESYSFWLLIFVHVLMLVEILMLKIFKSIFHKQVFDLSPSLDNNKTGNITEENEDIYIKFPAYSFKVFITVLKVTYN